MILSYELQPNYQFSYYIAEMANTFSNLFTIGLSLYGAQKAIRHSLPTRFTVGYAVNSSFSVFQSMI